MSKDLLDERREDLNLGTEKYPVLGRYGGRLGLNQMPTLGLVIPKVSIS